MASVSFKGNPTPLEGKFPAPNAKVPDFRLVNTKLEDVTLASFRGKKKILTINPSIDTGVCAATTRTFNQKAGQLPNTVVLAISADLPFALNRFCAAEGLDHVVGLSMMRDKQFGRDYGVLISDGPMAGLTARAVIVLDAQDKVVHAELVNEITHEPNYEAALEAARK